MNQVEFVSLDDLVSSSHPYRKFIKIWSFKIVSKKLQKSEKDNPYKGYGLLRLFKCILLQFMEDLSDRELERYLQENNAAKWFCDFGLLDKTPNYSVFSKFRKNIGTRFMSKVFDDLRNQLKQHGLISEVFSFVDASHLISKANLWKERDKAIQEKYEKLNNEVLPKVAKDTQARIGCKGGNKFWYGYKKHASVDMQSGLINKIAVTPANMTDAKGIKYVCPAGGAIYADKGYCTKDANKIAAKNNATLRAIKKNNMNGKNHDQDRFFSSIRSPYERVFSQQNNRVRYTGVSKNYFAEICNAICFNLKRLVVLKMPNLCLD